MVESLKCLTVEKGYIALVDGEHAEAVRDIRDEDISVLITEKGIAVGLKDTVFISIPEEELDYFVDNSNITVYPFSINYVEEPVVTVSLLRDTVVEARSIYHFNKTKSNEHPAQKAAI